MTKTEIIKNTKNTHLTSILFLIFVLVLTIWLYFYNNHLIVEQAKKESVISEYEKSIDSYKENKELKMYSLVQLNSKSLDLLEKNSKVTNFLDHMDYIKNTYDIDFRWFTLNKTFISTSILVKSDEYSEMEYRLAYQKLVDFISKYKDDENSLFDLSFINRIVWHDEMKLSINFTIK